MQMNISSPDKAGNGTDTLIKIGVIKELYKQQLLTEQETRDVIEFLRQKGKNIKW